MDVFNLLAKIGLDTSEYDNGLKKIASGVGTATKVIGAAVAAGTAVVSKFGIDSLKAGAEFDSSMSQVAATMGYSVEQLNDKTSEASKTFETLRNFAQEMGSSTAFSASESAEALNYMALAGYNAETSMKMLPTVLNLAAAGGIGLAEASDMVTDAQSALGLSLEETETMVNQMAKASSKSNTSVAQLGEAFLTIGANAKQLSGGTKELSTALGILADNGIKGAEGGTHLRNILLALNPQTQDSVTQWEKLSISAYDADGNLRPLEDTFLDLSKAMSDMSSQEKSEMLSKMFNKTDLAAVNALLDTQKSRWDGLSASIMSSKNAAGKMADTQLDNLTGDITILKSALEGAKIAISDELTPTLREFVQFGSNGISRLTEAFKDGGLSGAMEELGSLLSEAINKIIEDLPKIVEAGMKLIGSLVSGILDNIDVLVDAAFKIVESLANSLFAPGNIEKIISSAFDLIQRLADGILEALPELIPAVMNIIQRIVDSLTDQESLDKLINTAIDIIVVLAESMVDALPQLVGAVYQIIGALVNYLLNPENLAKIGTAAFRIILALATGIVNSIWKAKESITQLIADVMEKFYNTDWGSIGKNIVDGMLAGLKNAWTSLTNWVSESIKGLVNGVERLLGIASPSKVFKGIGGYMAEGLGIGWEDEFEDVQKQINSGLDFSAEPVTVAAKVENTSGNSVNNDQKLADAIRDALDGYEIKWDDRNLGRLVRAYA